MMVQSGAVLMLHPANPKSPDRILEITGTTPQVRPPPSRLRLRRPARGPRARTPPP